MKSYCLPTLVLVFFLALAAAPAHAEPAVHVKVQVIYASHEGGFLDRKIAPLIQELQSTFGYSRYELLDIHSSSIEFHRTGTIPLPGGARMQIVPLAIQGGYILFNVNMNRPDGFVMNTSFRLVDGGTVIVGGPRYRGGVLVLAVTAERMG